jgi:hypothetical protein
MKKPRPYAQSAAMSLRLDWCSYEAARFAVEKWHYSHSIPMGKVAKIGVWENDKFIGAIIYGRGANSEIGTPYGLEQTQICELVRVALCRHYNPVSKMIAYSLKMLRARNPKLEMVVSYADTEQGHYGGIYQASGWLYVGSTEGRAYCINGKVIHRRTVHSRYCKGGESMAWLKSNVDPNAERVRNGIKHKYVMPLTKTMRAQLSIIAKKYPKRVSSIDSDAAGFQPEEGGASPTEALRRKKHNNMTT